MLSHFYLSLPQTSFYLCLNTSTVLLFLPHLCYQDLILIMYFMKEFIVTGGQFLLPPTWIFASCVARTEGVNLRGRMGPSVLAYMSGLLYSSAAKLSPSPRLPWHVTAPWLGAALSPATPMFPKFDSANLVCQEPFYFLCFWRKSI